ncbi:hypothetical protein A176_001551 [Myxococcus hansupus]|uniref:Uncharacterized protein n=1 Tax=Pseudomyxococcus hansupus TaxID=1297742 RepID=A0A0H4WPF8_9BACT|nr:hypothetical protein A176_001551 [Myxococcus hansupus]
MRHGDNLPWSGSVLATSANPAQTALHGICNFPPYRAASNVSVGARAAVCDTPREVPGARHPRLSAIGPQRCVPLWERAGESDAR